jgi:hypothetical protein
MPCVTARIPVVDFKIEPEVASFKITFFYRSRRSVIAVAPVELLENPSLNTLAKMYQMMEKDADEEELEGLPSYDPDQDQIDDNACFFRTKILGIKRSEDTKFLEKQPFFAWATRWVEEGDEYMYLPTIISMNGLEDNCSYLWVSKKIRKCGAGSAMISMQGICKASVIGESARGFWDKHKIKYHTIRTLE